MHELLTQVYDLRTKNELEKLELRKTRDYQAYNTRTNSNTEKLGTITQLAKELIEQNSVVLSASGYAILATALALSNDPDADAYWRKAVEAAAGAHQKTTLMQNYGTYLYEVGRRTEGQQMFDAAAKLLAATGSGPFAIGRHHHVHAITQQQAGLIGAAEESYAAAAHNYASIENEQQRIFAEQSLLQSRSAQALPTGTHAFDAGGGAFMPEMPQLTDGV